MIAFNSLFKMNMKKRLSDGFIIGYNIIFPAVLIGLLGLLGRNAAYGNINSFEYYSVVMIPFCIIMSILTEAYAGKDDAYAKTAERIMVSPISYRIIVTVKVLTCTIAIFLYSMLLLVVISIVAGYSIKQFLFVCLIYLTFSFFSSAVGIYISVGMKNFLLVKNILNIPMIAFAVLGGTFFKIGSLNSTVNTILNISPLRWINRYLFMLLYDNNNELCLAINSILMIAALEFMIFAVVRFKKGEYIDGDLPGYEK